MRMVRVARVRVVCVRMMGISATFLIHIKHLTIDHWYIAHVALYVRCVCALTRKRSHTNV